jgi:2'-5' RNA ligase
MKRIFIAIDIIASPQLKEAFELIQYRMRLERINWVPAGNLHITLNFQGDTEENLLNEITAGIEEIAVKQTSFELVLHSFGVYKSLKEPRVLWVGCDPCPALNQLKMELDVSLGDLGFQSDNRPFSPHLTLGRVKEIRQQNQLVQLITLYKGVVFQKQTIHKIALYESKLSPAGPEYIVIGEFPFMEK